MLTIVIIGDTHTRECTHTHTQPFVCRWTYREDSISIFLKLTFSQRKTVMEGTAKSFHSLDSDSYYTCEGQWKELHPLLTDEETKL